MSSFKSVFNMRKTFFSVLIILTVFFAVHAQRNLSSSTVSSECSVDWINKEFVSNLYVNSSNDVNSSNGIITPAERKSSEVIISGKMAYLVKNPLLALYVDSANTLGDYVLQNTIKNENLISIINGSTLKPGVYANSFNNEEKREILMDRITMNASFNLDKVGSLMILHNNPYSPTQPIETVASRAYTGIIIDARGALPVQGEFVSSQCNPCFFPKIWDDTMELLYERNMMDSMKAKEIGIVSYFGDDNSEHEATFWDTLSSLYAERIGTDPLYISARKVFGTNRTDPVISRNDALKILSVPENLNLLKEGRIVILLNENVLRHPQGAVEKTKSYYTKYRELEQFVYEKKIPSTTVTDEDDGIHIAIEDLNFYPDSEILLPDEAKRLDLIAEELVSKTKDKEFTLIVEGHTASVGKPTGEMNLSYLRAQTIINELVARGINRDICEAKGYGGTKPKGDNSTEEGRAMNRRVEIILKPVVNYVQRQ